MTDAPTPDRRALGVVALLLLVGVGFRVWATGSARFTEEESLFWRTARDIVLGRDLPLYGPPLTGSHAHHPGPIFYYLIAGAQLFGATPKLGGALVAVLHGLAGGLVYDGIRRVADRRAGLFALALWVFAPWDVLYADRIWLSCVAPVWGTAALYAAIRASAGRAGWLTAAVALCVVAPQLHMSAPLLWAAVAAWLWLRPPPAWSRRALVLGLLLGALPYGPTFVFEATHGFENTQAILQKSTGRAGPMRFVNSPLRVFGNAVLASTSEISYHFQRGYWYAFAERETYVLPSGWLRWVTFHGPLFGALNLASLALGFLGWGATLRGLRRAWRAAEGETRRARLRALPTPDQLTVTLLAGLGAAVLLLVVSRKGYYPHYSNLLVPFVLWPVARSLAAWSGAGRGRRVRIGAQVWAAGAMVAMACACVRYYAQVDALNGLDTTDAAVRRVLALGRPVKLSFTGFDNTEAWKNYAVEALGTPLEVRADAKTEVTVYNDGRAIAGDWVGPIRVFVETRP